MKTFRNIAAQGDVMFRRLDTLPERDLKAVTPENGVFVIAHSETGHHHVMEAQKVEMFECDDALKCFLVLHDESVLEHKRDFDTHEPILFSKGVYEIRRQREYTPEGYRRAQD